MTDDLATGTYEVLRGRLRDAAGDLRGRFEQLAAARAEVFGNIETRLKATAHVSTEHNCVPRDLLAVGDRLLLGYNVQFGLRTEIQVEDVFSLYRIEEDIAHTLPLSELFDERVRRDFSELYRYYKQTAFARFHAHGPNVYFVFQVGKSHTDIKAFKWVVDGTGWRYVDNRSEQEVRFPAQHAFQWIRTTRDQHRHGAHPHISIEDILFVECVGGDLTIKVEDNTAEGSGIYSEPVDNGDQTLDDAEIYYCVLGQLVLLKIRPYQEREFRHLVFSRKRSQVLRLDAIERACVLLPQDHGIIFPGGFVLQTGQFKQFDHGLEQLQFERMLSAPNGEDYLYLFTDPASGTYLQLRYNVIRQSVDTPLVCHGQALFEDGRMTTFRAQEHPQKHHALQIWQTPFVSPNHSVQVVVDSLLYKIGNRELVQCMAECQELLNLVERDDSYQDLYLDLVKRATDILDGYHWIGRPETFALDQPLGRIRDAANAAIEEFEKVVRVRRETGQATRQVQLASEELLRTIQRSHLDAIEPFVEQLAAIREQRGHAIGLRERRYVDGPLVESLESQLAEAAQRLGRRCVQFLLSPHSLEPYQQRIEAAGQRIQAVRSAADGHALQDELTQVAADLELLIETVSQLRIDDVTQRTAIVDRTGNLLAELNRTRSTLSAHVRDLLSGEMQADFAAQLRLLDQAAAGALETSDTPEKVDESLTRMMLQLEELEGRFAEFDELLARLTEKRESLYEAFERRRLQLVEARTRRADALAAAAERILQGVASRAQRLSDADALRGYLASDAMVDKVRQIADQLQQLGDTVRMDDVLSRLKAIGDDSLRQLRDRQELFADGQDLIRLGKHQFSVNRQPIELTTVVRQGRIQLHLTGTQFFQPMQDAALDEARELWEQTLPSETPELYRGEFLAAEFSDQLQGGALGLSVRQFLSAESAERTQWLRDFMQPRHDEGYSRGVHDQDAALIAAELLRLEQGLGLLRYAPDIRGLAWYAWQHFVPASEAKRLETWLASLSSIGRLLPQVQPSGVYVARLKRSLQEHAGELFQAALAGPQGGAAGHQATWFEAAANYLFAALRWAVDHDLNRPQPAGRLVLVSPRAAQALRQLGEHLTEADREQLADALRQVSAQPLAAWSLAVDAVDGFLRAGHHEERSDKLDGLARYRLELSALLLDQQAERVLGPDAPAAVQLTGLSGDHPRIRQGSLTVHYHEFTSRLQRYRAHDLPRFCGLRDAKHRLVQTAQARLRIDEFKARVLTSFVRNRLIDEVYLPLIGDNLAKQLGAAGGDKRSDRMGLLLLISPPGYGKTTLMEYIANRLGLVLVKVNGPALGHNVTSLDPAEASNASAREEVNRINMALEMGDNVMLYLDDIQHCNPELLQKFIPLCDATRRVEGVWNGQPKTYDLRGRKVAVVMAGNPYTESGERFQIPDMLANRADVYNLGEIIGDSREAFELSYLENCLTSNSSLQALARASNSDQRAVIRAAERSTSEGLGLEANLSPDQLSDMLSVLAKLLKVRDIVLRINRAYIRSAAQVDAYRTEPPFKLQGSYRNMNRIAERVVPVMNDQELQTLIVANYEQDAQTLTRDGEANLLKFKELLGILTDQEAERWANIKYAYVESVRMQGIQGDDGTAQVLRTLTGLRDGLEAIRRTMAQAIAARDDEQSYQLIEGGISQLSGALTRLSEQVAESIQSAAQQVEQGSRQVPDQKVLVQHTVPRVMTDLVQSQFQLLYDGLRPVLEASAGNRTQLEALRQSIETCLSHYRAMQAEIDKATER